MQSEEKDKRGQIIAAAIKRFSHFGIHKTTITEIAEDVAMSRQAFLYYFHDKNALIKAVVEQMMEEYMALTEENFRKAPTAEAGIYTLLSTKEEFFKKYYLLAIQGDQVALLHSEELKRLIYLGQKKHIALLSQLLQQGVEAQEFCPLDTTRNARLILEILSAFEHSIRHKCGLPEPDDFKNLFDRQKEVLHMLVAGLKYRSTPQPFSPHLTNK